MTGLLLNSGAESETIDPTLHTSNAGTKKAAATVPPQSTKLSDWAVPITKVNRIGILPRSKAHYVATIVLGGACVEAIINTGVAKSKIHTATVAKLGLTIEKAAQFMSFGSFWGPSSKQIPYNGRIAGPINIHFGSGLALEAPEIKVVEHLEPLILIGTDVSGSLCTLAFT